MAPQNTKEVHVRSQNVSISLQKLILLENISKSNFSEMKMYEKCQKVITSVNFEHFLSTLMGLYNINKYMKKCHANSLHELILLENALISKFCVI